MVARLPDDFVPTDLHWMNGVRGGGGSAQASSTGPAAVAKGSEVLLITGSDGRYIILNRNARVERNVQAHQGSISVGRWSPDGSGLLTAGEDGSIKVWSKLGMLRSHIVQNEMPIRTVCWSPNSLSIAYCSEGFIAVKPLAPNSKLMKVSCHSCCVYSVFLRIFLNCPSSVASTWRQCIMSELVEWNTIFGIGRRWLPI